MRRRDVFSKLFALPVAASIAGAEEIKSADFDTVIVRLKDRYTAENLIQVQAQLVNIWPDKKCVVFPREMEVEFRNGGRLAR